MTSVRRKSSAATAQVLPVNYARATRAEAMPDRSIADTILRWVDHFKARPDKIDEFNSLTSDVQRFLFVERFVEEEFGSWTPPIVFFGKSVDQTKELLSTALSNLVSLNKSKYSVEPAVELFHEAIVFAPWRTRGSSKDEVDNCLAAVLAHRSTAFFYLRRYPECIMDIDLALALECPSGLKKDLLAKKAEAFLALHRPSDAIYVLTVEASILKVVRRHRNGKGRVYIDGWKQRAILLNRAESEKRRAAYGNKNVKPPTPWATKYPGYQDLQEQAKKFPLKCGRNKEFPAASAVVKLKYDDELGRHLVTRRKLDIGDVLMVEEPFVGFSYIRSTLITCYACFIQAGSPFPCKSCSAVVFCSPTCASGPKGVLHTRECGFWLSLVVQKPVESDDDHSLVDPSPGNVTAPLLMAVRTLLMKTPEEWAEFFSTIPNYSEEENDDLPDVRKHKHTFFTDDYDNVFRMAKRTKNYKTDFVFLMACACYHAVKVLDKAYFIGDKKVDSNLRSLLGGLVIRHAMSYTSNWNGVNCCGWKKNACKDYSGAFIHPTKSLISYACVPNLIAVHYGGVMVVRAIRPIKKGEVLSIASIVTYSLPPTVKRQQNAARMGYHCKCIACIENWPSDKEMRERYYDVGIRRARCLPCGRVSLSRRADTCPGCGMHLAATHQAITSVYTDLFPTCACCATRCPAEYGNLSSIIRPATQLFQFCAEPCYTLSSVRNIIAGRIHSENFGFINKGQFSTLGCSRRKCRS